MNCFQTVNNLLVLALRTDAELTQPIRTRYHILNPFTLNGISHSCQLDQFIFVLRVPGSASFVDHLCYFCLVFVMLSCASVY